MIRLTSVFSLGVPGLAVLAGLGAVTAQQQDPPRIDAAQVASQLELTADQQQRIAPALDTLNQLFARAAQLRQEPAGSQARTEVMNGFAKVTAGIGATLTPSQWRGFELLLDQAWAQSQGFDGRVGMRGMRGGPYDPGGRMDRGMMGYSMGMGWWPGCCGDDSYYYGSGYGSGGRGDRYWGHCRW